MTSYITDKKLDLILDGSRHLIYPTRTINTLGELLLLTPTRVISVEVVYISYQPMETLLTQGYVLQDDLSSESILANENITLIKFKLK
jgi:hypothetical protein